MPQILLCPGTNVIRHHACNAYLALWFVCYTVCHLGITPRTMGLPEHCGIYPSSAGNNSTDLLWKVLLAAHGSFKSRSWPPCCRLGGQLHALRSSGRGTAEIITTSDALPYLLFLFPSGTLTIHFAHIFKAGLFVLLCRRP